MPEAPDDISRLDPTKRIGDDQKQMGTPTQSFEQFMQKPEGGMASVGKPSELSPFDLVHGQSVLAAGPTFDTLLTQAKSAQSLLGDVSTQLNTPNLKLKQSQRYLLRNKLTDANAHLRAANSKLGNKEEIPLPPSAGGGVIGKFLDLVGEGNANIQAVQKQLTTLKEKGENLKPADFLVLQLKLATAQQEIEYSSLMLGKAVQDITTMMNIQL